MATPLRVLSCAALLALTVAPAVAQGTPTAEALAERRLRACLTSGSAGAPRTSLVAAVVAVRSLCHNQIEGLRVERLREVDARFGSPDTPLSDVQRAQRDKARLAASLVLNDEITFAVSNFTGLTQ